MPEEPDQQSFINRFKNLFLKKPDPDREHLFILVLVT